MEPMVHAEVESDMVNMPKQQHGAITTLHLIIKCIVALNQEAKDALEKELDRYSLAAAKKIFKGL